MYVGFVGLQQRRFGGDAYIFGCRRNFEPRFHAGHFIGFDAYVGRFLCLETSRQDSHFVNARKKRTEAINPVGVRRTHLGHSLTYVQCLHLRSADRCSAGISDRTG
jgi:hypothetical protein